MRATIVLDDEPPADAMAHTGLEERTAVVRAAQKAMVEREAAPRLAMLGGSEPALRPIPRRRPEAA